MQCECLLMSHQDNMAKAHQCLQKAMGMQRMHRKQGRSVLLNVRYAHHQSQCDPGMATKVLTLPSCRAYSQFGWAPKAKRNASSTLEAASLRGSILSTFS
jgi:hypothetical protein